MTTLISGALIILLITFLVLFIHLTTVLILDVPDFFKLIHGKKKTNLPVFVCSISNNINETKTIWELKCQSLFLKILKNFFEFKSKKKKFHFYRRKKVTKL